MTKPTPAFEPGLDTGGMTFTGSVFTVEFGKIALMLSSSIGDQRVKIKHHR